MVVEFKKSFLKEINEVQNKKLRKGIVHAIENAELAQDLTEVRNLKKLIGYDAYFRIRISDYRIGLKFENNILFFVTFDHRKSIYRKFP